MESRQISVSYDGNQSKTGEGHCLQQQRSGTRSTVVMRYVTRMYTAVYFHNRLKQIDSTMKNLKVFYSRNHCTQETVEDILNANHKLMNALEGTNINTLDESHVIIDNTDF